MQFNFAKSFLVLITLMFSSSLFAQIKVSGVVTDAATNKLLKAVEIYDSSKGLLATTNAKGYYEFTAEKGNLPLVFFAHNYEVKEEMLTVTNDMTYNVSLAQLSETLTEVVISAQRQKIVALKSLKDVEGTAIYAGKKSEVVTVEQSLASLATNNARQIYSQVAGLNIFENDDAGLQLNIGGRGLDPNRTANFNTRQNGYDISADVLGYPESYYAPAAEGLKEIQVIRGAASLQYGTQFGGLINFVMKGPNPNKPLELITRNTLGSNGLYTNFTSIGGTNKKLSYYGFFNYKKGDGFRPNSNFESKNVYAHLGYQLTEKTELSGEITYLRYLAKQAGGLTDRMFYEDPFQSNRSRNWFQIDWLLYNLNLKHDFTDKSSFTLNLFGLNAARNALGFRENRVSQVDNSNPFQERELLKGDFNNFGMEARWLKEYSLFGKKSIFVIGSKFYRSKNTSIQGPGTNDSDPNFEFQLESYPNYKRQSNYTYPNTNLALFGEHIIYLNDKFSITPGIRFEYIKTAADGVFKSFRFDGAGNVINEETVPENRTFERSFILAGLGLSYKFNTNTELYGNLSQNYRSVTFTDISVFNPSFEIDPNITDEKGGTIDIGFRGSFRRMVRYDISLFGLWYNNRIGFTTVVKPDNSIKSLRGNVGDALIGGIESLVDVDLNKIFLKSNVFSCNYFINTSVIKSEYVRSQQGDVEGKKVEFIPDINFKTGLRLGYKNLLAGVQYSYLGAQFSDASNSPESDISGIRGVIPSYDILDVSLSYTYKRFKLETGLNNVLDNHYFTRRATGYPGPGIIPSAPRNWYTTLQIKF